VHVAQRLTDEMKALEIFELKERPKEPFFRWFFGFFSLSLNSTLISICREANERPKERFFRPFFGFLGRFFVLRPILHCAV